MCQRTMKIVAAIIFGLVLNGLTDSQASSLDFQQIYSNTDGSVQFIVLEFGPFDSVQLPVLAGQTLTASDGKTEHSFTFANDVVNYSPACDVSISGPFCAYYVYVLVATQGFADLDVGKPDFIVPNGFLFLMNGSVRLGIVEAHYDALPADGRNARWLNAGYVAAAAPFNNAGERYSFLNYTGLWWAAPTGSESGWGIYLAHQGDTIFATWFTYDAKRRARRGG